jgi:hypothetical protein
MKTENVAVASIGATFRSTIATFVAAIAAKSATNASVCAERATFSVDFVAVAPVNASFAESIAEVVPHFEEVARNTATLAGANVAVAGRTTEVVRATAWVARTIAGVARDFEEPGSTRSVLRTRVGAGTVAAGVAVVGSTHRATGAGPQTRGRCRGSGAVRQPNDPPACPRNRGQVRSALCSRDERGIVAAHRATTVTTTSNSRTAGNRHRVAVHA